MRCSTLLRLPTERSWSWAPHRPKRAVADFPALRVLFCGSDAFSIPSFLMLRELASRRSDVVSDLGLMTPVDRRAGRGLKQLRPAPLTLLARRMNLPVHYASAFDVSASDLPASTVAPAVPEGEGKKWDLLVAVSFGHKFSADALQACTHGGLNLHPSRLPQHRGAAPLHRALMAGDAATAVSLQSIHPEKFDHGIVLARSQDISLQGHNLSSLTSACARLGSDLLREALLQGYPSNARSTDCGGIRPSYARKLIAEDTRIEWHTWTADKIVRYNRVLERPLWTIVAADAAIEAAGAAEAGLGIAKKRSLAGKVVKLDGLDVILDAPSTLSASSAAGTVGFATDGRMLIRCADGCVSPSTVLVAGKSIKPASEARELDGLVFASD